MAGRRAPSNPTKRPGGVWQHQAEDAQPQRVLLRGWHGATWCRPQGPGSTTPPRTSPSNPHQCTEYFRLPTQLVAGTAGAEALARTPVPALPLLLSALGGGVEGQVLALETLLRALSPSSRSRDSLVGAALARNLPQTLLARLGEAPQPADQVEERGGEELWECSFTRSLKDDRPPGDLSRD